MHPLAPAWRPCVRHSQAVKHPMADKCVEPTSKCQPDTLTKASSSRHRVPPQEQTRLHVPHTHHSAKRHNHRTTQATNCGQHTEHAHLHLTLPHSRHDKTQFSQHGVVRACQTWLPSLRTPRSQMHNLTGLQAPTPAVTSQQAQKGGPAVKTLQSATDGCVPTSNTLATTNSPQSTC